jgi:hypothetical protein
MIISKLLGGLQLAPPPYPPVATALRSNKPKNIYRFTIC